jgi:proline iminopeptidase
MISKFIKNAKYNTYLEIYGELNQIPIILIHGGPGASLNYLSSIAQSNNILKPFILYDQINSGKSTSIYKDNELSINNFTEQLAHIIDELKLEKCHLIGHSWGAIIAYEYYKQNYKRSNNIKSIVFYSPSLDIKLWQDQATQYVNQIKKYSHININSEYMKRHIIDDPMFLKKYGKTNGKLYHHLWGESEYNVNGILKNYNFQPIQINIPILFVVGEHDTASPYSINKLAQLLTEYGSVPTVKIIKDVKHIAHYEKPNEFNAIINTFYKNIIQNTFNKKNKYYQQIVLNNDSELSIKLIYLFFCNNLNKNMGIDFNTILDKLIIDIKSNQNSIQSTLDYWYFTKLLGYGNRLKPSDNYFDQFDIETNIKTIDQPRNAVLYYIYCRSLMECDYNKYNHLEKYFINLENIAKNNSIIYGYYLTHIILYDFKFGLEKKIRITAQCAVTKLIKLCKINNYEIINANNADLLGEIIICFKLCHANNTYIEFLIYQILNQITNPNNYHLTTVLAIASLEFQENEKTYFIKYKYLLLMIVSMLIIALFFSNGFIVFS